MKDAFIFIVKKIGLLIDVKSIVTMAMTAVMCAMLLGAFNPKDEFIALFSTSYGAVITYYFTRKDKTSIAAEEDPADGYTDEDPI